MNNINGFEVLLIPNRDLKYHSWSSCNAGYQLPDKAQNCPTPDVFMQPDFYYGTGAVLGTCVFIHGSSHDHPMVSEKD